MNTAPFITIFVRHSTKNGKPCKYAGDEFSRRCDCRKHLRWTHNGAQYRRQAGTRSWAEAEEVKREIADQISGRAPERRPEKIRVLQDSIDVFLTDKKVQGLTPSVIGKYTRELARLRDYCERHGVYTVQGISRELLSNFCGTWETVYPSSNTRAKVRERVSSFLRYAFDVQWIPRIPKLPKMKVEEPPTLPLTTDEYTQLLDAASKVVSRPAQCARVRALFQLMRYSGLAIRDALTLERAEIRHDAEKELHRIVTARQKTGTHVSVPIPPDVAKELLAVENDNAKYVFWSGNGDEESITKNWAKYYVAPAFAAAKITGGHMMSHRLRDTFAVDLLCKGIPLEEVSKLLGHESIKTTERHYAKWIKGRQDRLDVLVTGTWDAA
jgi:integrase/recombinase XerD